MVVRTAIPSELAMERATVIMAEARGKRRHYECSWWLVAMLLLLYYQSDHYSPLTRLHPLLQRAPTHLHNNLVPLTLWMVAIETLLDLYLGQITPHATVDGSLGRRAVSIRQG